MCLDILPFKALFPFFSANIDDLSMPIVEERAKSLVELPKGSGIVTRCPLVLRLRKSNQRRVYHLHGDNRKELLDESNLNILKYIESETRKLTGDLRNVVDHLIELQVKDSNVRYLTVVDLPGIARNPIARGEKLLLLITITIISHSYFPMIHMNHLIYSKWNMPIVLNYNFKFCCMKN